MATCYLEVYHGFPLLPQVNSQLKIVNSSIVSQFTTTASYPILSTSSSDNIPAIRLYIECTLFTKLSIPQIQENK
jgi:hypothetical protein